jgi:hypothetical protein
MIPTLISYNSLNSFCKKIIKYYQPHQLVVGLL